MSGNTYVRNCAFFRPDKDTPELRHEILANGYDYFCEMERVIVFKKRESLEESQ